MEELILDKVDMFLKELEIYDDRNVYRYYTYALCLVSEAPERIDHMIKYVYHPMSVHFRNSMICIERSMREALGSLNMKMPLFFEEFMKERAAGCPTVSEVLNMLVHLKYSSDC
ncbi:MAG: hypothetical protein IJ017_00475 [Oscillospiraceae bacterium]|nr:hypothetical protein [Oscillospiraceae bacterium]